MQVGLSVLAAIKEEVNKLDDWVNVCDSHLIQARIKKHSDTVACNCFVQRLLSKFIKTLADKVLQSCVPFYVTMRILFLIIVIFFIPPLILGCCFCY